MLATAGYDQAVNVWDCRANAFHALQTMRVFADSVTSVATTDRWAPHRETEDDQKRAPAKQSSAAPSRHT